MIIVCGGIKGGSGKTTAAVNLTIMRAAEGRDVLLIDADDQETASDFTQLRSEKLEARNAAKTLGIAAAEFPANVPLPADGSAGYTSIRLSGLAVRTQVMKLREKYDDIVIDTGGRDTTSQRAALAVADLLLVPFVPRSFDVWTLERVSKLVGEMRQANPNLRAATFLNRADARGQDNGDAADVLRETGELEHCGVALGTRKAFANAAAEGLAVSELRNPDPKALEEMRALYSWVFCEVPATGLSYPLELTAEQAEQFARVPFPSGEGGIHLEAPAAKVISDGNQAQVLAAQNGGR